MKVKITLSILLLCCNAHSQVWEWGKTVGGKEDDFAYSTAVDLNGNIFTTGTFLDTVDFDPGAGTFILTAASQYFEDIFISKLDSSGNFIWAKRIGGSGWDFGYCIKVDAEGNIYVSGNFAGVVDFNPGPGVYNLNDASGSVFICKLDNAGNFIWAKNFGASRGQSLAFDGSGNVITTGDLYGTGDFNPGPGVFNLTSAGAQDIFISKLDSSGNFLWAKAMGGTDYDEGYAIAADSSGNIYATGCFKATADFDPGNGVFNLNSFGGNDIFVLKLNSAGDLLWAKQMGGTYLNDIGYSLALDTIGGGHAYTTGQFYGTGDFDPGPSVYNLVDNALYIHNFISSLDSAGNFTWATTFNGGNASSIIGNSIALDGSGNIYSSGVFSDTVDFDPGPGVLNLISTMGSNDIYVSKLDGSGNFIWAKSAGGVYLDESYSLALNPLVNGVVYAAGRFDSPTISFDSNVSINADSINGYNDIFIAKLIDNCAASFSLYPDTSQLHSYWIINNAWGTPPLNYDWDWGDGSQHDTIAYPSHIYATAGFYPICLSISDASGCSNTFCNTFNLARMDMSNAMIFVQVVASIPTSIKENQKLNFSLFPNPANEEVVLLFNQQALYTVQLYNTLGDVLFETTNNTEQMKIDIRNFQNGIYFIAVLDHKNLTVKKLVKFQDR